MHEHNLTDETGDTVDVVPFCCDNCHREWCESNDVAYDGWSGAHEAESTEWCAWCGVVIPGYDDSELCDCQRTNVVVNMFRTADGRKCEHGNYIQLPEHCIS